MMERPQDAAVYDRSTRDRSTTTAADTPAIPTHIARDPALAVAWLQAQASPPQHVELDAERFAQLRRP